MMGEDMKTYQMAKFLFEHGIYASPITYPGVRKGMSRVRLSVMATHTPQDITRTLKIFEKAKKRFSVS